MADFNHPEDLYNSLVNDKPTNQSPEDAYNNLMGSKNDNSWSWSGLAHSVLSATPMVGPLADTLFSDTPFKRIMSAFGQSFADNHGLSGTSPELERWMIDHHIYNDYTNHKVNLIHSANEALLRPLVALGYTGVATLQGLGGATSQFGTELRNTAEDIQAMGPQTGGLEDNLLGIAAAPFGSAGELVHGTVEGFLPEASLFHGVSNASELVRRGRAEGAIGEGESSYFGTKPISPETKAVKDDFISDLTPEPTPQPDIHSVVRTQNPDLFSKYDALTLQRERYRAQLASINSGIPVSNPDYLAVTSKIDEWLAKVGGDESKLSKNRTRDIAEAREVLETLPKYLNADEVRQKILSTDFQMRDLAPDVAKAYKEASTAPESPVQPVSEAAPTTTKPSETAPPEAPQRPVEPSTQIADKVSKKLRDLGRDPEEADAAAAIVQAYYNTRAARFKGALGTPDELFNREFPEVVRTSLGSGAPAQGELAQYGGIRSTTARLDKFNKAVQMEQAGHTPEQIRLATGWFRSPYDKKWKYEFSDKEAKLTPAFENLPETKLFEAPTQTTTLGEVLDHPTLYKAYPEARNIEVRKQGAFMDMFNSYQGWFDKKANRLVVTPYAKEPLETILHEIQHWIQGKEGFARGGNAQTVIKNLSEDKLKPILEDTINKVQTKLELYPKYINIIDNFTKDFNIGEARQIFDRADELYKEFKKVENLPYENPTRIRVSTEWLQAFDTRNSIIDAIREKYFGTSKINELSLEDYSMSNKLVQFIKDDTDLQKIREELQDKFVKTQETLTKLQSGDKETLQKAIDEDTAFKLYQSIAGEIEARDTEARMNLSDKERAALEPYSSQAEFKPEDSIVSYDQAKRGSILINKGNIKNIIKLGEEADASTFMHEMGHQFLEDLRVDAKHPEAPEDLLKDSEAINKWLKANPDKPLTRAQHERFARGFEKYLMEGRAPSPELASVFAKFKAWLVDIYKTLRGLNVKLNDDVRGVFDRLLSRPEEEPTIVPENIEEKLTPTQQEDISLPLSGVNESDNPLVNKIKGADQSPDPYQPREFNQSKYLDKDGNINFDAITSDEDLKDYLRQYAAENNNFFKSRKGNITTTERLEAADLLGVNARTINSNLNKLNKLFVEDNIPVDARFIGLKKALEQNAYRLKDFVMKDDPVGYLDAQLLQMKLMKTFLGIRTTWGRLGQALQAIGEGEAESQRLSEFFQKVANKTFDEVKTEMATLKNLDSAADISSTVIKNGRKAEPGWGWYPLEVLINAYISGPITHFTYSVAQKLLTSYKYGLETLGQATVSKIKEQFTELNPGEKVYYREVQSQLKELSLQYTAAAGHRDGFIGAKQAMMVGKTVAIPGENSVYDFARRSVERSGLKPYMDGYKEAVDDKLDKLINRIVTKQVRGENLAGDEAVNRFKELKDNFDTKMSLEDADSIYTHSRLIPGVIGTIVRAPGERMVAPLHTFDRFVAYRVKLAGLATRMAMDEGLEGAALAQREAELLKNPPDDMMAQARDDAWEAALLGGGGDFTRRYQQLLNAEVAGVPVGRYIQTFVGIPGQIIKMALVDRGPFAVFSPKIIKDLVGKNGSLAQTETMAKLAITTGAYLGMYTLYKEGLANPGPDPDPKKRAVDLMEKGLPHAFHVGHMTYAFDKLGVLGMIASEATDLAHTEELAEDSDYKGAALYAFHSTVNNIEEVFSGFSDLFDAIHKPETKGTNYVQDKILGFVPVGLSQTARLVDPYQRETKTFIDKLYAKLPGLSEDLPERIDIFGQPIPNKEFYGVYAQQVQDDPVANFLAKEGYFPGKVKDTINGVQLTPIQYKEYATQAGVMLRLDLQTLMDMPGFYDMPKGMQHEMIVKAVTDSRTYAGNFIMAKYTDLIQKSIDNKLNILNGTQ
jgi:hypothetical protein